MNALILYGGCVVGAFALYILNRTGGRQPFSLFSVLNVDVGRTGQPGVILLDMIISSAIGCLLVFWIAQPQNQAQAVVAGLGMTGLLSSHAKGI